MHRSRTLSETAIRFKFRKVFSSRKGSACHFSFSACPANSFLNSINGKYDYGMETAKLYETVVVITAVGRDGLGIVAALAKAVLA